MNSIRSTGPNTNVVLRARDKKLARSRTCWSDSASSIKEPLNLALSRRKQGFESPRERQ